MRIPLPVALRDLYAAAYLEGLADRPTIAPTDPATTVRLDDTGRAAAVPLRACGAETFHTGTGLLGRCRLPRGHAGAHSAVGPW